MVGEVQRVFFEFGVFVLYFFIFFIFVFVYLEGLQYEFCCLCLILIFCLYCSRVCGYCELYFRVFYCVRFCEVLLSFRGFFVLRFVRRSMVLQNQFLIGNRRVMSGFGDCLLFLFGKFFGMRVQWLVICRLLLLWGVRVNLDVLGGFGMDLFIEIRVVGGGVKMENWLENVSFGFGLVICGFGVQVV